MTEYYSKESLSKYTFYKIPKFLFTEEKYKKLSLSAKVLYCFIIDRASLSSENNFIDEKGKIYVFMTNQEVCEKLTCSHVKASKIFKELEKLQLIERKKQGICRAYIIYPKIPYLSDFPKSLV